MSKLVTATLKITPESPIRGVYYVGQYGTSGYATAAKGYLYHYFTLGIPVTWDPLYFDDSKMEDDDGYNIIVKSFINKKLPHYDIVILHSTPDLWGQLISERKPKIDGKIVIGYCTWETNKLPSAWVNSINNTVHELWVPSSYNAEHFKESGVTKLIRVVPHIFLPQKLPQRREVTLPPHTSNDRYTFYTIGEWNFRKSIEETIRCFCETFTSKDNVRLIVKTHYKDYSYKSKIKCEEMIESVLSQYENLPEMLFITENLSSRQILGLHAVGDCYVALTKSEGFGLTIFDAMHYGKQIITTGYGGQLDFLGRSHPGLVRFKMGNVKGMESGNYTEDQEWAYPDLDHAKQLMRQFYGK